MRSPKRRNPWIAGLLSLLLPGLGHLYNGAPLRGLLAGLLLFLVFILLSTFLPASFSGLLLWACLGAVGFLAVVVDAFRGAKRAGETPLRWYNRGVVYVLLILLVSMLLPGVLTSLFRFRAYRIPAASMEPTLRTDDFFIVDMWHYRTKAPQRGEVIVFRYPQDPSRDFVMRCVAVPGDLVAIRDKQLFVNGRPVAESYAIHKDPEIMRGSSTSFPTRDNFGPFNVPPDSCFCLGDNRDNSNDSRFWGPVEHDLVRGKALYVYRSRDASRRGLLIK